MKKFLDADHPMFARAWVRWVTVLLPALWAVVEYRNDAPAWAAGFAGLAAYAFVILIVKGPTAGQ